MTDDIKSLEGFLSNEDISFFEYVDNNRNSYNLFKEKINNRFYAIYSKMKNDSIVNFEKGYDFSGFFDIKTNILYNANYKLRYYLKDSKRVVLDELSSIERDIRTKCSAKVKEYAIKNSEVLKENYRKKFDAQSDYIFDNYMLEVDKLYIKEENLNHVELNKMRFYYCNFFEANSLIPYTEYLNNPFDTIKELVDSFLKKDNMLDNICCIVLEMEYKNKYLNNIKRDLKKYASLELNRKILSSVKNLNANNVNITISYNNKKFTFKFPYDRLIGSLLNADSSAGDFRYYYRAVEEFLYENKTSGSSYDKWKFDFSNITSITYGRKELYSNDIYINNDKNNDLEEIEI